MGKATGEREKNEVSEQIREWQSFRPERSGTPAIDDKDLSAVLRGGLRELRDKKPHKPFIALLQLRELPAKALDLALLTER